MYVCDSDQSEICLLSSGAALVLSECMLTPVVAAVDRDIKSTIVIANRTINSLINSLLHLDA
jgi:hypothetical protein